MRATRASKLMSQPNCAAYTSPCAITTQPRSPGLPNRRMITIPHPSLKRLFQCQNAPVVTAGASARQVELLEAAYSYVLAKGLGALSLRPLAAAIGSSPRVLLFLFGSKDGLVRALLARARTDELAMLGGIRTSGGMVEMAREVWAWLAAPEHRALLTLWTEAYARSLVEPDGPWSGFAAETVRDWLDLLGASPPESPPDTPAG